MRHAHLCGISAANFKGGSVYRAVLSRTNGECPLHTPTQTVRSHKRITHLHKVWSAGRTALSLLTLLLLPPPSLFTLRALFALFELPARNQAQSLTAFE
jgi:hypothetical protein